MEPMIQGTRLHPVSVVDIFTPSIIRLYAILITIFFFFLLWKLQAEKTKHKEELRRKLDHSRKTQRGTIKGNQMETLAPLFMESVNSISEVRFLGEPIDFIGFKGLDNEDEIDIKFIEVKTGKKGLTEKQKRVKEAVDAKRVKWVDVRAKPKEMGMEITEKPSGENE